MSQKYSKLTPFYRGDTPLFISPVTLTNGGSIDLTGWTGYLTFNLNQYPTDNTGAFLHVTMTYSLGDTLGLTAATGTSYSNYFYYQFTNTNTELLDPTATYYWDVQINKTPTATNNFTLQTGTFTPYGDISRGLV